MEEEIILDPLLIFCYIIEISIFIMEEEGGNDPERFNKEALEEEADNVANNSQALTDSYNLENITEAEIKAQNAKIEENIADLARKGLGAEDWDKVKQSLDANRERIGSLLDELRNKEQLTPEDLKTFNDAITKVFEDSGIKNIMKYVETQAEELSGLQDALVQNPEALEKVTDQFIERIVKRGVEGLNEPGAKAKLKKFLIDMFNDVFKTKGGRVGLVALVGALGAALAVNFSNRQDPGCKSLTLDSDGATLSMQNATDVNGNDISSEIPLANCSCVKFGTKDVQGTLAYNKARECSPTLAYSNFQPQKGSYLAFGLYDLKFFIQQLQIEVGGAIDPNTYVIAAVIALGVIIVFVVAGLLYKYYIYSKDEQTLATIRGENLPENSVKDGQ